MGVGTEPVLGLEGSQLDGSAWSPGLLPRGSVVAVLAERRAGAAASRPGTKRTTAGCAGAREAKRALLPSGALFLLFWVRVPI